MATYLGIDIGQTLVRALLVRVSYRKLTIEGMGACEVGGLADVVEAVRFAVGGLAARCDGVAVSLPGERIFLRRMELPAAAQRQLAEIIPFEIEAQIPFELEHAVFDYRPLPRGRDPEKLRVFAAIARTTEVQERIDLIKLATGHEPEAVLPGAFSLAALIPVLPELSSVGQIAILDIGAAHTEVLLVQNGEISFARTLSVGTQGLPASASVLARELRQTLAAWRASGGGLLDAMYISGGGALAPGAEIFLSGELGVAVRMLPMPASEGLSPEQVAQLPRFAKALGLALSLGQRGKHLNLRQGPLKFERGFGFLRERVPALVALGVVIVLSAAFSLWAELRALGAEREVLEKALFIISKEVWGEGTTDPERVKTLMEQGSGGKDLDPLPPVDAFDVLVQLAESVDPASLKHDLDEVDVQRGSPQSVPKVTLHGIVPKVQDAEDLSTLLKQFPCFQEVKVIKTSQQIGGDGQKYHMEFELRCPAPGARKVAGTSSASPGKKEEK
ncbi:MAG: pilus assembly protein PilM [Myxococcales bacterium]|nr:pilus assembly protein PilM [Polyangiaceae bacterium]MDW8250652.1 pilus assembly protein PilM [Myxococcales bacterium]